MAKKKFYKIVCTETYRNCEPRSFVVERFYYKRDANAYLKTRCYTTVTRTFHIEEYTE